MLVDSRAQYEHGLAFGVRDDMPVDVHIRKDTGKSKQTVNLIACRRANATANMYYKCALSFIDIEVLFRGEWHDASETEGLLPFTPSVKSYRSALITVVTFMAAMDYPTERAISTPIEGVHDDDLYMSPDEESILDETAMPDSTMDFEDATPSPPPPPPPPAPSKPEARVMPTVNKTATTTAPPPTAPATSAASAASAPEAPRPVRLPQANLVLQRLPAMPEPEPEPETEPPSDLDDTDADPHFVPTASGETSSETSDSSSSSSSSDSSDDSSSESSDSEVSVEADAVAPPPPPPPPARRRNRSTAPPRATRNYDSEFSTCFLPRPPLCS